MVKYSKEIVDELCKYVRAGNTHLDSAILSGISEETFYKWKREKTKDGSPNPDYHIQFSEALKKAEQECKARNIAIIQRAADKSWQAAAWYLERRYHDQYALKTVMEHSSDPEKPLTIKIVSEMNGNRTTHT